MTSASVEPSASEEHVVNEFGYRQELRRTLILRGRQSVTEQKTHPWSLNGAV